MVDEAAADSNPMRQHKVPHQQPAPQQPAQQKTQPEKPSQPPLATRPDRYRIFK
jgi:hypothetical protein